MNSKSWVSFAFFAWIAVASTAAASSVARDLDFDGDGRSDAGVYVGTEGRWYTIDSASGAPRTVQWGYNEARAVPRDYDGDGRTDIATYVQKTGYWHILPSGGGAPYQVQLGGEAYRPVPADYDGDGKADLAVFRRDTGEWRILRSSDAQTQTESLGGRLSRPVPADFDGDGKADLAVWERDSGTWYIMQSSLATLRVVNWGWREVRPVVADYDGDGKADLAVYHAASGTWSIWQSGLNAMRTVQWGWREAVPVPADYDGDGKADIATYHRKVGGWYILNSSNQSARIFNWGWSGATALPTYCDGGIRGEIVLAYGDSITYGTSSFANGPATGYPILLDRRLNALQGGHFSSVNGGNPGDQTSDGLARLPAWLSYHHPDLMLLMMGTNDGFYKQPYNTTYNNLLAMVRMAQQSGASVMVATIPPVISNEYRTRAQQEAWIESFNPYVYQLGRTMGIPVVPVWESITSIPGWQYTLIDQQTANHPNDAGYQVVRDAFYRVVEQNLLDGYLW